MPPPPLMMSLPFQPTRLFAAELPVRMLFRWLPDPLTPPAELEQAQVFHVVRQRVLMDRRVDRVGALVRPLEHEVALLGDKIDVVAGPPYISSIARVARQHIVAAGALEYVVSAEAVEDVIAGAALFEIVAVGRHGDAPVCSRCAALLHGAVPYRVSLVGVSGGVHATWRKAAGNQQFSRARTDPCTSRIRAFAFGLAPLV